MAEVKRVYTEEEFSFALTETLPNFKCNSLKAGVFASFILSM